jgi:2-phospho-L-lactate guanylyltransferase
VIRWAVVPAKPLGEGKSRLASLLSPEERAELSRRLLYHTLRHLAQVPSLDQIAVISRDAHALSLAKEAGALPVQEHPLPSSPAPYPAQEALNRAIRQAQTLAASQGVESLLILPADLPLLDGAEIEGLIRQHPQPGVLIVPSHDGGTNALLLSPVNALAPGFGPGSFRRHLERAHQARLPIQVIHSPQLAFDLDLPGDLARWRNTPALRNHIPKFAQSFDI